MSINCQGRNRGRKHVDPVEQIPPELALENPGLQVPVGGRDDPDIDANRLPSPQSFELAFLKNPEPLGMGFQRQLANFVEKDCPAVGDFKPARPLRFRPGEGAPFVPSQTSPCFSFSAANSACAWSRALSSRVSSCEVAFRRIAVTRARNS